MTGIHEVPVRKVPIGRLTPVIGEERTAALREMAAAAREELAGSSVWTVTGGPLVGGVSELNRSLLAYTLDADVDARWCAVEGDAAFQATCRDVHRQLHGFAGNGHLGSDEGEHYAATASALGEELAAMLRPGDVVLLHDAPTAALAPRVAQAGAHVIWRCHVGADEPNELSEEAWAFLEPHLELCQAFIFSRAGYAPDWLPESAVTVIPPSVDPFSPKNEELTPTEVRSILSDAGIVRRGDGVKPFRRRGMPGAITSPATLSAGGGEPLEPDAPVVLQVSRWDRLKDMAGVLAGHVEATLAAVPEACLVLAGPALAPAPSASGAGTRGRASSGGGARGRSSGRSAAGSAAARAAGGDEEAELVLAELVSAVEVLPAAVRERVRVVLLATDDPDENGLVVNALQRHASVVVQKSLAEGFGLTVAEAMWKARPVVASAVGGIVDQLAPGTGVLLPDPADTGACGQAVAELLKDGERAAALGEAARQRVLAEFVGDQHLAAYAQLMGELHLRMR